MPKDGPAARFLRQRGIDHAVHEYRYDGGGAPAAASALGLPPGGVAKTLVFEADGEPIIVIAAGDREVSVRAVGRLLGARRVGPADPAVAERLTGYRVGGISPFATRRAMRVICDESLTEGRTVIVNGGRRGLLVELNPVDLVAALDATVAAVS